MTCNIIVLSSVSIVTTSQHVATDNASTTLASTNHSCLILTFYYIVVSEVNILSIVSNCQIQSLFIIRNILTPELNVTFVHNI